MKRLPTGIGLLFDHSTRRRMVVALIGSILVALLEIVALATMLPLVQVLTTGEVPGGLLSEALAVIGFSTFTQVAIALAVIIFGAFLVKGVVALIFRWWITGFVTGQQVRTSTRLLNYYLKADYRLHLQRPVSEFVRALNDGVAQTYTGVMMGAISIATEVVTILAIAITLLVVMPIPAIGMIVYLSLAAGLLQLVVRKRALDAGEMQLRTSKAMFTAALQSLLNYKDIKVRDNSRAFLDPYRKARIEAARATRIASFLSEVPRHVLEIVFVLGVSGMTIVLLATGAEASAIEVLAVFALGGFRVLPSASRLMASTNSVRISTPGFNLVLGELIAAEPVLSREADVAERMPFLHRVRLEDVHFRYPDGDGDVIDGVDMDIAAGLSVAIVGGSGAGKTTLIDLLLGLHTPTRGRITVDGVDIAAATRAWQHNIAMVPQHVSLLAGTVRDNIHFGAIGDPDDDAIRDVLQHAQLHEWLASLPKGLETSIGEGGVGLSGGQRQRLGIARALLRRPRLLLLDEATSALDNATEKKISDVIESLRGQITVVIVAHRLSTVKHCDMIAFMSKGKIADSGTFAELTATNAEFRQLVELGSLSAEKAQQVGQLEGK